MENCGKPFPSRVCASYEDRAMSSRKRHGLKRDAQFPAVGRHTADASARTRPAATAAASGRDVRTGVRPRVGARTPAGNSRESRSPSTAACRRRARAGFRETRRASGTPNPCFLRFRISEGSSLAATSFRMCLRRPSLILSAAGSADANLTTSLSSSGTRDSIECAMLMRSTFVSTSSGKYVSASNRII